MMRNGKTLLTAIAILTMTFLAWALLNKPAAASYYSGKTITIYVPVAAGGGLDQQTRLFARYWRNHIPGNPDIIVNNMPGGGGATALNYVYGVAKPDGLSVVWGPLNTVGVLIGLPNARYVPEKFELIGAGGAYFTTIMRTDVGPGIKKGADVIKAESFRVGGRSADQPLDLTGNLALEMIGAKYRYVAGYGGMAAIRVAIERNEMQAGHSGATGYHTIFKHGMIKEGKAVALWYHPTFDLSGNVESPRDAFLPEVKSFVEVYEEVHSKKPSGRLWDAYVWFSTNVNAMTYTVFAPPGTPKEAVNDLRKGHRATIKDPEYVKLEVKTFGAETRWISLEQGLKVLQTYRNATAEILSVFKEMEQVGQRK